MKKFQLYSIVIYLIVLFFSSEVSYAQQGLSSAKFFKEPKGLVIAEYFASEKQVYHFCPDSSLALEMGSGKTKNLYIGEWEFYNDTVEITLLIKSGKRGIGTPWTCAEGLCFNEYVDHVEHIEEDFMIDWDNIRDVLVSKDVYPYELKQSMTNCNVLDSVPTLPGKYPEASYRRLNRWDLYNLKEKELDVMQMEIYARYGLSIKDEKLRKYFDNQEWYFPEHSTVRRYLTEIEEKNLELIAEEKKRR